MILAALGLLFSCQRPELLEEEIDRTPDSGVTGESTIRFSTLIPSSPDTKAMGDAPLNGANSDIKTLFLVVFDENGMLVEVRKADSLALTGVNPDPDTESEHEGHYYEASYEVTLTNSDQPRIIHFIANCPVEQIVYGHETSIIGNMYVEKDDDPETPETAYWARIEVDDLIIDSETDPDNPEFANDEVADAFKCVPMLRNFAQITVVKNENITAPTGHTFVYEGFTLYNTVDKGTVAPYNKGAGTFQSFIDPQTNQKYKYPDFLKMTFPYEGHALAAAELNQNLEINTQYATSDNDELKYKWYKPGDFFYMYERKVSVKTAEEDRWNESPPHIIIKGKYDGQTCYYKADLVYEVIENDKVSEIVYYNILRNFKYQFTLTHVENKGYATVAEAVKGATSNNLAGSATTSKFTNISDNEGRMWVSYTEKVLVTGEPITLYYRYKPDLDIDKYNNNRTDQTGGVISIEDLDGVAIEGNNVIKKITVADEDEKTGEWTGYRKIDIEVNLPEKNSKEQTIVIKTDKATLSRKVHYILKQKYTMNVVCTPKIEAKIGEPVQVDIKLPEGLTESMFPLHLLIEVDKMSLSPDPEENEKNGIVLPVETGTSTIPGKEGQPAFYYVLTIPQKSDYDNLPNYTITTYWESNIANSAATVYVSNQYFLPDSAPFGNGMQFEDVKINDDDNQLIYGPGEKVSISFTKNTFDENFTNRNIVVKLNGLIQSDGSTSITVKPKSNTVTITDLLTTSLSDEISFTVEEADYITTASQTVTRYPGTFSNLIVGDGRDVLKGDDVKTSISFTMHETDENYKNRTVVVTFDGLIDENGAVQREVSLADAENRTVTIDNLYTLNANGNITFSVSEKNGTYTTATSRVFYRRDRAFTDVGIVQETVGAATGQDVTFNFTIPEEEFTEGMVVNVDMVGLVAESTGSQGDKDVLVPVTKAAANSYTYTPSKAGDHTLYLQTTENVAGTCSVSISASGFTEADDTVKQESKETKTATLTFDNTRKRTVSTNSQQTWVENDITFTNDKASATQNVQINYNPIRLRKSSSVTVSVPNSGVITKIVFDCNANNYATTLKNSIGNSATVSQDKVTVNLNGLSNEYVISQLSDQVRLDAITVTYDI